ncbi:hypothetical protein [Flavobacterium hiemivividum]|uniref:Uncharacterized protein n=1 Tax=Flavobacterium hiemivividum TaxID=2541734 RepID=A0A4V2Z0Y5_9FLAO|nr:hypothetical protein [Flavobacterium hiemivividum]TDE02168.1 hypothetical protein E0F98_13740 [Flavobacterium hiemivividum]
MNWIRKTIFIMGLSLVLLFAFNADKSLGHSIEIEKSVSVFSSDNIHTSAFIQPQISNIFVVLQKTSNSSLLKYLDSFLTAIPDFKIKTLFNRFANQDINRCEMVSLLLFPYHSFW